jgi:hypothetical protein
VRAKVIEPKVVAAPAGWVCPVCEARRAAYSASERRRRERRKAERGE